MKKLFMGIIVCAILLGCTSTEQAVMQKLYTMTESKHSDIKGDYIAKKLLLYKSTTWSTNEVVFITKLLSEKNTIYFFDVEYMGDNWKFIDSLEAKVDSELLELPSSNPKREIENGTNVFVTEKIGFIIIGNTLEKFRRCSSLVIQYQPGKPIIIPAEGVEAMKEFLKE